MLELGVLIEVVEQVTEVAKENDVTKIDKLVRETISGNGKCRGCGII